jgi:hypothetical protein
VEEFRQLMKRGTISFYGYSYSILPKEVGNFSEWRLSVFFKRENQEIKLNNPQKWDYYSGYQDTPWDSKDIVFFDQNATKSICIGFPAKSKYVAISLRYPKYYFYILLGILRRLKLNSIAIKGIVRLSVDDKTSPWLLIKCRETPTNSLSISSGIGVAGLLDFLRTEKIRYVVARFYDQLPALPADDADLDLIVDHRDADCVKSFLTDNPGEVPVDIYTDNGTDYHGMSYIPPKKAKEILERAIKGPGNSLIPSKQDALDLIIYHAVYHKGYISRLPRLNNSNPKQLNENKYLRVIDVLRQDLGVEVGNTLEEMDYYMDLVGWRPAIDTLAKIAQWNEWVRDYHMSSKTSLVPLYVLILKEGLNGTNKEVLLKEKCREEGLKLLEEKELLGEIKEQAISELRGGVWNDSLKNISEVPNFYPYKILVFWDTYGRDIGGIAKVKGSLRQLVDTRNTSLVHSSDNYLESLDYIRVCIPGKYQFYKNEEALLTEFSRFSVETRTLQQKVQNSMSLLKRHFRELILKALSH